MARFRWIVFKLRALFHRADRERDLRTELQFHLDADTEEAAADGLPPAAARAAARRRMGSIARTLEDTRHTWGWPSLGRWAQDLRYAARVLRRRPVFTVTACLSLALGIGANTALFSLLNNLLLRPLPVERPQDLVTVSDGRDELRYSIYDQLHRHSQTLASVIVMTRQMAAPSRVVVRGEQQAAFTQLVSDDFFDVLGVPAAEGRLFHTPATGAASEAAAVISDAFWRTTFGGDPSAVGTTIRVFNRDVTIVGIAPPRFRGTDIDFPVDVWTPFDYVIPANSEDRTRGRWVQVMGRVRPGLSHEQAASEASAILRQPVQLIPGASGFSSMRDRLSRPLLLLQLVAALVLLITCANLANLALVGSGARERELAIRQAIGASSGRIVRQLLTESLLLGGMGGLLALIVAPWTSAALLRFLPPAQAWALPNLVFGSDARTLGFITALSFLSCLLFGVAPALRSTRRAPTTTMRMGPGPGHRTRTWSSRGLIVVEVALCTLLLIVAGVFVRTLQNLRSQDTGYREEQLLVADVEMPGFSGPDTQRDDVFDRLRERTATLPGVAAVGFSHIGQLSGHGLEYHVWAPGSGPDDSRQAFGQRVTPGFFEAMGTRVLAGRDFTDGDDDRAPAVAIVNQVFARTYLPGESPVGRHFVTERASRQVQELEVVGVVGDSKWTSLRSDSPAMYYVPYKQFAGTPAIRLAVRASGRLDGVAGQLVQAARGVDPRLRLTNVVPFREVVDRTLVTERLVADVSASFGLVGLAIASIGLYGVLAYGVVRRRRELGVRIALGASPGSVEWMVLRESLVLLIVGFATGLPLAVLVTRLTSSMLFGLPSTDPVTIATTLATLTLATVAASYVPARRAATTDPVTVLRED